MVIRGVHTMFSSLRRAVALVLLAMGCSSYDDPPSAFVDLPRSSLDSGGVTRVCGVVPGTKCDREGEITRCLCGKFEEQIGRFVCCHNGNVVIGECQQALYARDCDGNPAATPIDAGTDD
jgi:hypothetical protein